MKELLYIFLGGGTGSLLRYLIHLLINGKAPVGGFPWATFTVNILGCFLIGVFYSLSTRFQLSPETRLFLTVGICGGFTTFSTFSYEALNLLKGGLYGTFFLYALLSMGLGILAVLLGILISK
ncbi:fluoride efflux transporter CrcB [Bacteroides sp. 224]|uniref:fluoride efflux transporter CrcB n=1 Tax=Bacteroides sp. 224 TaxID=2302936 RepID=UPI0013D5D297|nr:fluoride efflux transporter CrcB [Bacteroides sp. 224]NDV65010.1 fluoride efflux transporter CrcB [Bacteroides sp. 224]